MSSRPVAIFDLDGTLTDSKSGIIRSLAAALERNGVAWREPLDSFIGPPASVWLKKLMPGMDEARRATVLADYRAFYADFGWIENCVYKGVEEMLCQLRSAGWDMFICTSMREDDAHKVLDGFNLAVFFRAIFADSSTSPIHDKSDLLGRLLSAQHFPKDICYMVGDRVYDIEAARVHNLKSIGVSYGYGSHEELIASAPNFLCHSVEELTFTLLSNS